ncbi:DUF771 domain-containing protein [Evansella halocellulosilytica]|nr:DUF771 domain-containing protein [Evansella halocellulosilytica]
MLDVENGGFVYYPKIKGQTWAFQANRGTVSKMRIYNVKLL